MARISLKGVNVSHRVYDASSRSVKFRLFPFGSGNGRGGPPHKALSIVALSDIDLSIGPGERIALLGANGAGKSTLLRVLTGLLPPVSGAVRIEGTTSDILDGGLGLNPKSTCSEYIVLQGLRRGHTRRKIREVADKVFEFCDTPDWFSSPSDRLSPGQLFSLQVASALQFGDDIIAIDEIIEAADGKFVSRLVDYCRTQLPPTSIVIVAERVRSFIESFCDRAIVLESGTIAEIGTLGDILERDGNPFTI